MKYMKETSIPLNIACSAQQYGKKTHIAGPFNLPQFFPAFLLYSFFCISVAVLLKCFIILKVGLVEIYNSSFEP